jgi:hypothetical protein
VQDLDLPLPTGRLRLLHSPSPRQFEFHSKANAKKLNSHTFAADSPKERQRGAFAFETPFPNIEHFGYTRIEGPIDYSWRGDPFFPIFR